MAKEEDTAARVLELFADADAWLSPEHEPIAEVRRVLASTLCGAGSPGSAPLEPLRARFEDTAIPEHPSSPASYFDYLLREIVPKTVKTCSPSFVGHMTSALPGYVLAMSQVLTALNQNIVKEETSGVLTLYERQAIAMLHRLVFDAGEDFYRAYAQDGESTLGMIVSGGTLANLAALWCARNAALGAKDGLASVEASGLSAALAARGYTRAVIIGSTLMHFSAEKAADILGLGADNVIRVPADLQGRIDLREARRALVFAKSSGACVVSLVGIAGSTEVGSIDPLDELAELAAEHRVHFHVDAAWGGPVLFSPAHAHKLAGIARADSVTIDGHKQLYLPVGLGTLLLRDPSLAKNIERLANYVARAPSRDLGKRALEGSRPPLSLHLHAALAIVGRRGFAWLIEQGIAKAASLCRLIEARPCFELLAEPELNIVVYRYRPEGEHDAARLNAINRALQEREFAEGHGFVSRTLLSHTIYGELPPIVALRAVLANPLTTREHLESILDEQAAIGARLAAAPLSRPGLFVC